MQFLREHTVSTRSAIIACVLCTMIGGGAAYAGASVLEVGRPIRPGPPFVISGYHYTCQSTTRTPNFSCYYGMPYKPSRTPILTVWKGERSLYVQSLTRPRVVRQFGEFVTTIKR